jgi:hypothetical protein
MPVTSALMPMTSYGMIAIRWLSAVGEMVPPIWTRGGKPGSVLNNYYLISSSYELKLNGDPV